MIELPDGRISRTLPEQVGFNSKKIKEIIDFLNGADLTNKLIDLGTVTSPIEGTLTAAQREIADLPVAFITLNDLLYIKSTVNANYIIFASVDIESEADGLGHSEIFNHWVRITKATNAWKYEHNNVYENYELDRIDELLAEKANLTGATFTGPVQAQTFKQTQPNFALEVTPTLSAAAIAKGLTLTTIYNKVEVINNILYIVSLNKVNNPTESSITLNYDDRIGESITLPEDIADKIYDQNGVKVSESGAGAMISLGYRGGITSGFSYYELAGLLRNDNQSNVMIYHTQPVGNITLAAGSSLVYEDRLFLTLL